MNALRVVIQTQRQKGQVIVLVAISLVVILALAALAIDVGMAYGVKAKLNSAIDGAAIAAGRGVKQGATDSERVTNAQNAAVRFFNANYPTGYMGSTLSSGPTTTAVHNNDGSWTITVTARAVPPRFFARAVGWGPMDVRAFAETKVRDLDMILVLDTSGSMANADPQDPLGRRAIDMLAPAAWDFINRFQDTSGGDRIGVVTFASGAVVNVPINNNTTRGFDKAAIRRLLCTTSSGVCVNSLPASGSTASGEAMRRALTELNSININIRSSLRVIVFFSDGAPNDAAGTFTTSSANIVGCLYSEADNGTNPRASNYYRVSESRAAGRVYYIDSRDQYRGAYTIANLPTSMDYSTILGLPSVPETRIVNVSSDTGSRTMPNFNNTECNVNRAARNMVENVANTARSGTGTNAVTIYTLGLGQRLRSLEASECNGYGTNEWGENILKRLANTADASPRNASQPTGLYVYAQNTYELSAAFQTIANQILRFTK